MMTAHQRKTVFGFTIIGILFITGAFVAETPLQESVVLKSGALGEERYCTNNIDDDLDGLIDSDDPDCFGRRVNL